MLIQSRILFDLHTDGKNLVDPCAVLHSALGKVGLYLLHGGIGDGFVRR